MLHDELERASKRDVSRETSAAVEYFMRALAEENERQNLVSPASIPNLINRHILDGAQLLSFVDDPRRSWIDIGTGPGLPGLIIALINDGPVTLVEPRKLRISFLERMVSELSLAGRVPMSTTGRSFIFPVWTSVIISKSSSSVPIPPGRAMKASL